MAPRIDPGLGPFASLLGARRLSAGDGRALFALALRDDHLNPYGVVHGGVLYSLVDYAMGAALVSRLGDDERCATLELKINYLAPVSGGEVRAEAWVIARTKRVAVLEAHVRGETPSLLAVATGTFYVQSAAV